MSIEIFDLENIRFHCPSCNSLFEVSIDLAGKRAECEVCSYKFDIPSFHHKDDETDLEDCKDLDLCSSDFLDQILFDTGGTLHPSNSSETLKDQSIRNQAYISDSYDGYFIYMKQINNFPRISQGEEELLAFQFANGDSSALSRLIESNLKLVAHIARSYFWANMDIMDLIQEGNLGLMRAAERYDYSKGAKFSTYASFWINQSIRRYISNFKGTIRVPIQSGHKLKHLNLIQKDFVTKYGRSPSIDDFKEMSNYSERTILALLRSYLTLYPLEGLLPSLKRFSLYSHNRYLNLSYKNTPEHNYIKIEQLNRLNSLIDDLDEREKQILIWRYGLNDGSPMVLEEISQIIGRTRERVRQIENSAMSKLRVLMENDVLLNKSESCNYHKCIDYQEYSDVDFDESIRMLLVDIMEENKKAMSLFELIEECGKIYPYCSLSESKIRALLKSPLFYTRKTDKFRVYELQEWNMNGDVNHSNLDLLFDTSTFNTINNETPLDDKFETMADSDASISVDENELMDFFNI